MPVLFNRERESRRSADAGDVVEMQGRIEDLQLILKRYRRCHTADLRECLEDIENQLLFDPTVAEFEVIKQKIELMEEKIEDIEDMYDIEDADDYDSIRDELEDLLDELEDSDLYL